MFKITVKCDKLYLKCSLNIAVLQFIGERNMKKSQKKNEQRLQKQKL